VWKRYLEIAVDVGGRVRRLLFPRLGRFRSVGFLRGELVRDSTGRIPTHDDADLGVPPT